MGDVYVGDRFVNAELVWQGYADAATFPPNVRYADYFVSLQRQARETKVAGIAQYQLRMTFRRDNRTLEPESLVLRQAGDSSDEAATLVIPTEPR